MEFLRTTKQENLILYSLKFISVVSMKNALLFLTHEDSAPPYVSSIYA